LRLEKQKLGAGKIDLGEAEVQIGPELCVRQSLCLVDESLPRAQGCWATSTTSLVSSEL